MSEASWSSEMGLAFIMAFWTGSAGAGATIGRFSGEGSPLDDPEGLTRCEIEMPRRF